MVAPPAPGPPPAAGPQPVPARLAGLARRELPGGLTLHVASTRRARALGLGGLGALPAGHGLLLAPCRSVHTLTMRFALDLVWLGRDGRPLRVDAAVAPRRARTCLRARAVVECAAGDGERFRAALGGA